MNQDELNELLEQQFAKLASQITKHLDDRAAVFEDRVNTKLDGIQTSIDNLAGRAHSDEQERAAMTNQLDRQEGWINQLAESTATKLAAEQ